MKRIEGIGSTLMKYTWLQYIFLILITVIAASLRFYKLGEWSFWIDEIFTVNHATSHFSTPELILAHIPPSRNWIPLSVILTAQVFNGWGTSELSARIVAATVGIATIPILFFLFRNLFNTRVALVGVLLLAVSTWHIEWSQNARGYTSLMLFYTLALIMFYFGLEKDRIIYFILFFVFLYLAASERLIALLILPVIIIYLVALIFLPIAKPTGFRKRNILILLSPVVIFGILQVYEFVQYRESMLGSILNEIVTTFVGKPIENPLTQVTFMVYKLGIPLFVFTLFSGIYLWFQKNKPGFYFTLGAIIPFALVVIVTPFMFTEERYAFVTLPCWIVVASVGIDQMLIKVKKYETFLVVGILCILLVDSMGSNLLYFHTNHGNRRNWKGAFTLVQKNMQEGDLVVSTWPELGRYYLKQDVLLWENMDSEKIKESNERVWFVVIPDMAWYTNSEDFYWWVAHNTRMIKTMYLRTIDDTNLEIYLFDPASESTFEPLKD